MVTSGTMSITSPDIPSSMHDLQTAQKVYSL